MYKGVTQPKTFMGVLTWVNSSINERCWFFCLSVGGVTNVVLAKCGFGHCVRGLQGGYTLEFFLSYMEGK